MDLTQTLTRLLIAYGALTSPQDRAKAQGLIDDAAMGVEELLAASALAGATPVAPPTPVVPVTPAPVPAQPVPANPFAGIGGIAQLENLDDVEDEEYYDGEDFEDEDYDDEPAPRQLMFTVLSIDAEDITEELTLEAITAVRDAINERLDAVELADEADGNTVSATALHIDGRRLDYEATGTVVFTRTVEIGGRTLTVAATVGEHDTWEAPLVDLVAEVTNPNGDVITTQVFVEAVREVLPSIVEHIGAFELDEDSIDGAKGTLKALLAADRPLWLSTPDVPVFAGTAVVNGQPLTVTARVTGGLDPEEPVDVVDDVAGDAEPFDEPGEPVLERHIHLTLVRENGLPLTEQDVRGGGVDDITAPLGRALLALRQQYGEVTVGGFVESYDDSTQTVLVTLNAAPLGQGALFQGTLPFGALGRIKASATIV